MMLFFHELKKTICSIAYLLFIAVLIIDLHSQGVLDFRGNKVNEPQPGAFYGMTQKEIPEIIMPAAVVKLWNEFRVNDYHTYPVGLIKHVRLNDREQEEIAETIAEITGVDKAVILATQTDSAGGGNGFIVGTDEDFDLDVRSDLEYSEFTALMQRVDEILGGGSDYHAESLIGFGNVPIAYEEAVRSYRLVVSEDRMTGGYARLFADYTVTMAASILPVFLAVILCMKDRRAKMTEIIYSKKASAVKIVTARYAAVVAGAMLPIVILSFISNSSVWGAYPDVRLDYLAPLKYDLGWIMPSVMIAVAVGMCLTELTNTPIAIIVQGFWWLADVNAGIRSVEQSYSLFRLAPRHNAGEMSYFRIQDYMDNFSRLTANRILFAGLSLLLLMLTVIIYNAKRKGKLDGNIKFKRAVSALGDSVHKFKA